MLNKAKQEYAGFLIRFAAKIIDIFIILFDDKKQGLHDKVASTYVVKE